MDEKLLELAEQAWGKHHEIFWFDGNGIERFAELVRLDERTQCAKDYLEDCARAVEKARLEEREACAKLCDELSKRWYDEGGSANDCAAAIRGRTE